MQTKERNLEGVRIGKIENAYIKYEYITRPCGLDKYGKLNKFYDGCSMVHRCPQEFSYTITPVSESVSEIVIEDTVFDDPQGILVLHDETPEKTNLTIKNCTIRMRVVTGWINSISIENCVIEVPEGYVRTCDGSIWDKFALNYVNKITLRNCIINAPDSWIGLQPDAASLISNNDIPKKKTIIDSCTISCGGLGIEACEFQLVNSKIHFLDGCSFVFKKKTNGIIEECLVNSSRKDIKKFIKAKESTIIVKEPDSEKYYIF